MKRIISILKILTSNKTLKLKIILLVAAFSFLALPVSAGFNLWTTNGPVRNTASAIAISPNYASDSTVFAGIWGYGVYKSTDGGESWTQMNNGLSEDTVLSIAISPNYANDSTVFVGMAHDYVDKSIDGGESWFNSGYAEEIAISPNYASDSTVFAFSYYGVYKSTDGGSSWAQMNSGLSMTQVQSLAISPNYASDSTVFVSLFFNQGVYKSTDGGSSWTQSGLTYMTVTSLAISPNYANDSTVFAGTYDGVYKSTDGGSSWAQMNSGLQNTGIESVAISYNYASDSTVFVGTYGGGVYKSTDGGESWTQMNNGLSEETVLSIAISPNYANDPTVFAGTLDGVFSYTGFGTGVTALILPNGGDVIPSGGIYGICWEAPLEAVKFNLYYSLNNRAPWNFIKTVTGMYCIHWDVPVVTANKKKCRVKVIGYDSVGIPVGEGISDQPFAIEVLRVTSPNGGETLESGDISTIQWTTHKTIRSVAKAVLKYTTDGSTWKKIKTLTGNPVSFNWKVPAVSSAKCKVKIILKDASGINIGTDVSDKVFTIQP